MGKLNNSFYHRLQHSNETSGRLNLGSYLPYRWDEVATALRQPAGGLTRASHHLHSEIT